MLHGCSNKKMDEGTWRNEIQKEQISLEKEAEKPKRKVVANVSFDEGSAFIDEEIYTECNEGWKKL